jgi:hypothetical protein
MAKQQIEQIITAEEFKTLYDKHRRFLLNENMVEVNMYLNDMQHIYGVFEYFTTPNEFSHNHMEMSYFVNRSAKSFGYSIMTTNPVDQTHTILVRAEIAAPEQFGRKPQKVKEYSITDKLKIHSEKKVL